MEQLRQAMSGFLVPVEAVLCTTPPHMILQRCMRGDTTTYQLHSEYVP